MRALNRYNIPISIKTAFFILVVASSVSLYFLYVYYTENQEQAALIKSQSSEIENKTGTIDKLQVKVSNLTSTIQRLQIDVRNLNTTVDSQEKEIESNQRTINELAEDINNLITDVQRKDVTIGDLGIKLTGTQHKLEELKPTIKNYYVVGVTSTGQGVVIPVEIKVVKGSGSILVNVKNVDLGQQAQDSIRTAALAAGSFSGINLASKDISVTFVYEGTEIATIDGGSGGAALTVSMLASLENRTLNTKVLITGTIESNQSIGKVGSVVNKAIAAKGFGATSFLVPKDQLVSVEGIEIIEVSTLSEVASRILT